MRRFIALMAIVGMLGITQAAKAQDVGGTVVRPSTTDVIKATVYGGHWAEVGVIGDGDTDLDLYVYDPAGRLVGFDDDPTDDCFVRFFALVTGTYTIKVVNRSNFLSNAYVLAIR